MNHPFAKLWSWQSLRLGVVLAAGITLSFVLWWREHQQIQKENEARYARIASRVNEALRLRVTRVEHILEGFRGLNALIGQPDRKNWGAFLDNLDLKEVDGLSALAWVRSVPASDFANFASELRSENGAAYQPPFPANGPELMARTYGRTFPDGTELSVIDLSSDELWAKVANETRASGETRVTELHKSGAYAGQNRLTLIMPVYRRGQPVNTEAERIKAHYAWVMADLQPEIIFAGLGGLIGKDVNLEVHSEKSKGASPALLEIATGQNSNSQLPDYVFPIDLLNQKWEAKLSAQPSFFAVERHSLANQLLAGGLFTTVLICLLIWNAGRTEKEAVKIAQEMTQNLREREWELDEARRIIGMGTCLWDIGGGKVQPSHHYRRMFGLPDGEITNLDEQLVASLRDTDQDSARECLAKARRLEPVRPQIWHTQPANGPERVLAVDFATLKNSHGKTTHVLGIAQDITERVATDHALADSHLKLNRLMGAMPGVVFQLKQSARGALSLAFMSEGASVLFGWNANELINNFSNFTSLLDQTEITRLQASFAEAAKTNKPWHHEMPCRLRTGERRWIRGDAVAEQHAGKGDITWHGVFVDITATKQAELALRENEQRLRFTQFAVDNVRDAVAFVDEDGWRIYVNEETSRLTGYSRDELMRTKICTTFTALQPEAFTQLWALIKRQGTHTFEAHLRAKSGEVKPVEVGASFINFGGREIVFAIARDISARKASEQALRASEERLRLTQYALDHARDLVSIMDREGSRLYVNEAYCNFSGRSREEAFGTKVWTTIPSLNPARYQSLWDDIKRCGTLTFEVDLLTKSGERRPLEVNASFINFGGREAVCTISRDLSARKAAEHEKKQMEQQLRETQKLESLGVLAGGIAHDFNNLLTGILGHASLARDKLEADSDMHEPLRQIERSSTRAAELCQQMLAYAGKGRFIVEPVDFTAIVEDTAKLIELSVARRATLELKLEKNLPKALADATQMRQIVMNLVINAAEAINHQAGKITVTTGCMKVDQAFLASARVAAELPEGEGVFIEVSDNGSGMDRSTLDRIFEPFFTTKFTGRGLGLAAVSGIVRSHHGALHVHSEQGKGTTFRLVLAPCRGKQGSATPFKTSAAAKKSTNSGRILVVDDEETVRSVTRQALERTGYVVETAEDGEAAVERVTRDPFGFNAILLDYTMPRLDGAQTLREIRRLNPNARVILMSGFPEQETRERLGEETLEGFVQKPFEIAYLRSQVEKVASATVET